MQFILVIRFFTFARFKNKFMKYFLLISIAALTVFSSCTSKQKTTSAECGLDTFLNAYIDTTVKPQDNFFLFSMGKWICLRQKQLQI